jgi:hypothetical protein
MTVGEFSQIQKERNRKSQLVRSTKSENRAYEIRAYKAEHLDISNRSIAKVLGYSLDTVNRALKK